jgi:predicted ATP-binding protein involved in virulence
MTYWHMQLHPNDLSWGREKELLEKKALIGLGLSKSELAYKDFKSMQINDIVLIKHGENPIALVKVIGELEDINDNDFSQIDWFQLRRKIEILEFADSNRKDFPQPRKTLQKAIDKTSDSYIYIDSWYKSIVQETENMKGLKLRKLYIENHNMFKDFNIGFDNDNKALPIIILAGINGTGKTTILEYINDFVKNLSTNNKSYIKFDRYDEEKEKTLIETLNYESSLKEYKIGSRLVEQEAPIKQYFKNNIIYLPTDTHHNIEPIENIITEYLKQVVWEDNNTPQEAYIEIKGFINSIFDEFSINISFDSLDKNEKVIFTNKNGDKFPLNKISTGEKTLLSKAFYLFIQNIRDKVILIDEPELSLHPSWQSKILKLYEKFAEEYNCQIILSTHSPHIIGSAKKEYIRILKIKDNKVEAINNLEYSYGLETDKILTQIMGLDTTRTPTVAKKIALLWEYLENEDYKNQEFQNLYNELENIIGSLDKDLVLARLEIAKLKSQNA